TLYRRQRGGTRWTPRRELVPHRQISLPQTPGLHLFDSSATGPNATVNAAVGVSVRAGCGRAARGAVDFRARSVSWPGPVDLRFHEGDDAPEYLRNSGSLREAHFARRRGAQAFTDSKRVPNMRSWSGGRCGAAVVQNGAAAQRVLTPIASEVPIATEASARCVAVRSAHAPTDEKDQAAGL